MLPVVETFVSIQGESTYAGLSCFFVRLAMCNLRCRWCDTVYAQNIESGTPRSIDDLLVEAENSGAQIVELTGGEPLLHPEVYSLMDMLLQRGFTVLLETNGSINLSQVPPAVVKIVDCKTPSSGEAGQNCYANYGFLTDRDQVKFVIADRTDYDFAREIIGKYALPEKAGEILLSAVFGEIEPAKIVQWMLSDRLPVRFQLQMHKFIWNPNQRKV